MPARISSPSIALRETGQAEVGDSSAAAAVDHHVGRLQVAMQNALIVGRGKAGAELARDLQRLLVGQAADPPQQRGEVLAVDVLHGDEVLTLELSPIS